VAASAAGRVGPSFATILLSGLLLGAIAQPARSDDDQACFGCHGDKIDAKRFAASAHGDLGCAVCHTDVTDFPHPEKPAAPECAGCHDEVTTALAASVHGRARQAAGAPAAGCTDCHGDIHAALPHTDPQSAVHWGHLATRCARCHAASPTANPSRIPMVHPVEAYLQSVHARAVMAGRHGATCADCHGTHAILPLGDPGSRLGRAHVATTCGTCHAEELAAYRDSVHGEAAARGVRDAPVCTDCHGEHAIFAHTDPASPVFATNVPRETCGRCHDSIRLNAKYGLGTAQASTFRDSYHGLALRAGQLTAANCASCHGAHDIRSSRDPRSHVHPANLPVTCGKCHPGAGTRVALGPVHVAAGTTPARAVGWIRLAYLWLIGLVVGGMAVHNLLDLLRKARRPTHPSSPMPQATGERMSRVLRWQHGLVMLSFPVLVYSGFALTYPESWWAAPLLAWESRFGLRGLVHRGAAIVLVASLGWHLCLLAVRPRVRACLAGLLWSRRDLTAFRETVAYYLGRRVAPPPGARFGYVEKAEYWAFLWGTALMAATGAVLWFENLSLRYLPKWVTDVATAIHFYEAILATLAVAVWHLYWVIFDPDVYPMDGSWWHGREPAARTAERAPSDEPAEPPSPS
jgi:cytochrome b subunit of formate dehydrogenase